MNLHGFSPEEVEEMLQRERLRIQQHDEWCNDNEGRFTDADGVQTMTSSFGGKGNTDRSNSPGLLLLAAERRN